MNLNNNFLFQAYFKANGFVIVVCIVILQFTNDESYFLKDFYKNI